MVNGNGISTSDTATKRDVHEIAADIHLLLKLHETSIIDRYIAWLAGIPAADSTCIKELCVELLRHARLETNSKYSTEVSLL